MWCDGAMVRWCNGAMVQWCDVAMVPEKYSKANPPQAFYVSCIVISYANAVVAVMEKLATCGKCHNRSVVAASTLSSHKFLTYATVAHAR